MTSIRMFVLAYMIFLILTEHALPYLHGKRLFGVLVPGQIRYGAEGAPAVTPSDEHAESGEEQTLSEGHEAG